MHWFHAVDICWTQSRMLSVCNVACCLYVISHVYSTACWRTCMCGNLCMHILPRRKLHRKSDRWQRWHHILLIARLLSICLHFIWFMWFVCTYSSRKYYWYVTSCIFDFIGGNRMTGLGGNVLCWKRVEPWLLFPMPLYRNAESPIEFPVGTRAPQICFGRFRVVWPAAFS